MKVATLEAKKASIVTLYAFLGLGHKLMLRLCNNSLVISWRHARAQVRVVASIGFNLHMYYLRYSFIL
jgi:hypothetical protein